MQNQSLCEYKQLYAIKLAANVRPSESASCDLYMVNLPQLMYTSFERRLEKIDHSCDCGEITNL